MLLPAVQGDSQLIFRQVEGSSRAGEGYQHFYSVAHCLVFAYIAAVEVDAAVSAVAIDDAASAEEVDAAAAVAAASPENVDDDMAHCSSAESADASEAEAATAAGAEYCNGNTPAESKAAAVRKP